jgi:SAM-dependent methyltransferase
MTRGLWVGSDLMKRITSCVFPVPKFLRTLGYRLLFRNRRIPDRAILEHFREKNGLEVGGPSLFFRYSLPVYRVVKSIDGVNFSPETIWEGSIDEGRTYSYGFGRTGFQYIGEATDLVRIPDDTYDFVLSCHSLEHVANPLKALHEWKRVVRNNGHILLVLPNKESNFDHRRPVTSIDHLLEDYSRNVGEDDLTHLAEILRMHDLKRDRAAGNPEQFASRSERNFENRGLHHHVFDLAVSREMIQAVRLQEISVHQSYYDFVILARVSKLADP